MANEITDMTIGMTAEWNGTGAKQAEQDISQVSETATQAAQQHQQAAQQQQAAEQATAEAMRFTAMGKQELVRELEHLTQARQQAAAAGDAAQYENLTKSINNAKQALEGLNTGQSMATIATVQQAQAGMQMAQGLESLAKNARSGSVDMATMASQVIALGMAFKAGLGPIGWAMAALQGLQAVMQTVTEWDEKEAAAIRDTTAALEAKVAAMDALRLQEEQAAAEMAKGRAGEAERLARQEGARELDALKAANAQKQAERERDLQAMRSTLRQEADLKQAAVARGEVSKDEYDAWKRDQDSRLEQAEQNNRLMANAEKKAVLDKEQQIHDAVMDARNALYRELSEKLDADETALVAADDGALQVLTAKYDALEQSQKEKQAAVEDLEKRLDDATGVLWDDADKGELEKQLKMARESLAAVNKSIAGAEVDMELAFGEQLDILKKAGMADSENLAANARRLLSLKQQLHAADTALEEGLQKGRELAAQRKALQDERAAIEQGGEEHRKEAAAAAELAQATKDAAEAQKQAAEDEKAAAQAKADAEKAQADRARAIQKELSGMASAYKTTGNYAVQDTRTQAEILDADRRALWQREMRLRQLLAEAQDADTRQAISAALEETAAQQRGLAQATAQAAQEARKALAKAEPPDFSSNNRMVQRNLDRLAKVYANLAKRAERQAASGNDAALERTQRLMARYAERMGRMARDNEKAVELTRKTNSRLDLLRGRKPAMDQPAAPAATQENPQIAPGTSSMANPVQQPAQMAAMQEQAAAQAAGIADLAAAVQALATAAEQTAKTAAAASAAAKASLKSLADAHKTLDREVDDLRRLVETLI